MDDREQKILDFMSDDDYVPMKAKEIAMLMRVPKNEYHDFLEIIGKLELELKIEKNRKNRYKISEKTYYEGYYRKNSKGFGFVKLEDREEEIYISKENSLNALNRDHVLIEITDEGNKIKRPVPIFHSLQFPNRLNDGSKSNASRNPAELPAIDANVRKTLPDSAISCQ